MTGSAIIDQAWGERSKLYSMLADSLTIPRLGDQ